MKEKNSSKNVETVRVLFFSTFSFAYLIKTYFSVFDGSMILESDFLSYFLFYNISGLNIDRWGVEIITPVFFWLGELIGLDFFEFVYVVGVIWLFPILLISRLVRIEYLLLYYAFFLIWFSPQYAFLMRHYFAVFFVFLFFRLSASYRYFFFFLSFLSHLSIIFVYIFSFIKFKHRVAYVVVSLLSIFIFITYHFGFSLVSLFVDDFYQTGIGDIDRKLNTLNNITYDYSSGSFMVYLVLCLAIVFHSFKIEINGPVFSLERAFYFSALASLILSEFVIFSNRVGILAYFFSIPYLLIVISKYSFRFKSAKV